eukprot:11181649-Lingulodinium_polyedra.AAC.1
MASWPSMRATLTGDSLLALNGAQGLWAWAGEPHLLPTLQAVAETAGADRHLDWHHIHGHIGH